MKTKLSLLGLALCGMVAFTGCDDDDNNYLPDQTITKAFDQKYPNAGKVKWDTKNGYEVADFNAGGNEAEAWFDNTGKWIMTKTEINFGLLPEIIRTDLRKNNYKDWKYTEFDKLERFDAATVYVIEAELGEQEMNLYYTEDGILVKEVPDKDNENDATYQPTVIPDAIKNKLAELYPNASFLEYEVENNGIEVDIRDGNIHKEVFFTPEYEWIYTEWEIALNALPSAIHDNIATSIYAQWKRKDEVNKIERPGIATLYIVEVEKGEQEMDLYYTEDGILVKEVPDKDNENDATYQPTVIPDAIKNKLAELYPNASFLEYEVEKNGVEVDIFDGNIHKEVFFTPEYEWVYTEWEIYQKDVPAIVMQALRASAYGTYLIDDIHVLEKPAGLFYEFELEQGDREIKITFDAAGILI